VDYDGLIAIGDAQVRAATAQATIADTLAGVPQKLAQAELTRQQAIRQQLENLAKFLDIRWDAQAHQSLIRVSKLALQKATNARQEAKTFADHVRRLTWLMSGSADATGVVAGWIAFYYVLTHLPAAVTVQALSHDPAEEAFDVDAWKHPNHAPPVMVSDHDGGTLLDWARKGNCYPRLGSAAWLYLSQVITAMSDGSKTHAAQIVADVEKLEADARALQMLDWKRLDEKP
jgi:hypothetical protein